MKIISIEARGHIKENLCIYLLVILFFIKAIILAFTITPLWDIPDETGHFAYVKEMATNYTIPLLGKSNIGSDVLSNLYKKETTKTQGNWIAQHPPVYYFAAAAIYKIGTYLTSDAEILFRIPRIASALFGALTLLLLYNIFQRFRLDALQSLFLVAFVAFLPMYSNISSGTNNDMGVTFFTTFSVFYWVVFLQTSQLKNAYFSMFWISVAAATKMTALVVLGPMLLIILFELRPFNIVWLKKAILLAGTSMTIAGLWMIRNFFFFNNPFATSDTVGKSGYLLQNNPLNDSVIEMLSKLPFYEHFFINFFGLFGWIGATAGNSTHWIQIGGVPLGIYSLIIFLIVSASLVLFLKHIKDIFSSLHDSENISKLYILFSLFIVVVIAYLLTSHLFVVHNISGHIRRVIFIELGIICVLSCTSIFMSLNKEYKIYTYALIVLSFFIVVITWRLYGIYLLDGRMRATHGRYFYPLIPMMMIGIFIPVIKYFKPTRIIMLTIVIILIITEAMTFFKQAIPWYEGI